MIEIPEKELKALRQYQDTTSTTAIYPEEHALSYLSLGLLNEIYEYISAPNSESATSELGDMMWFVSELANLAGTDLCLLLQSELEGWQAPVIDAVGATMIVGDIAEASGAFAKHLRDGSPYHDALVTLLHRSIQTLYSMIDVMSGVINPSDPNNAFVELLESNREKLVSRQQRGVLGGSGNKR